MRKICFLSLVVMLFTIAGCEKDEALLNVQNPTNTIFSATTDNGSITRTALDANNNVLWSEGDKISVFSGTTDNISYTLQDGEGTTYGVFEETEPGGTEPAGSALSANVAYYPYDSEASVTQTGGSFTINATFPVDQTFSESGTFGIGASPMVAVTSGTSDTDLSFKNVGAIFRLQLKGEAVITKVVFSADANLAGKCNITASNVDGATSAPAISVAEGSNVINLDCGTGVQLSTSEPTNFIVSMLPIADVEGGITATIYDNAGKKMVYKYKDDENLTIERSKAYSTAEVTYTGEQNANITPTSVQALLDNATSGAVIQLEPGVNYGTLYFSQNSACRTVDITNIGGDAAGNEKYSKYENITILGAPGATVDQIAFQTGKLDDEYIWSYIHITNLTVRGVAFSGQKTAFNIDGSKSSWLGIDGLFIDNCTMNDASGANRFVFQQLKGTQTLNDKSTSEYVMTTGVKNLTISDCKVNGVHQFIETREMEGLTISNNTIKNTTMHAILLAVNTGANYSGNITITGNTAEGINERFVRMAGATATANIGISNNTIKNYLGADSNYIKVTNDSGTDITDDVADNNTMYISDATVLKKVLAAANKGTTYVLAADNYSALSFTDPANYKAKDIIIVGENGTTIDGFSVNSWSADNNIEIDGLTFKNIKFTKSLLLSTKVMSDITVQECDFVDDACIHQNDRTEQLTNLKVLNCTFTGDGDESDLITAVMLENTENVNIEGCTFTNIDFNVFQSGIIAGTVLMDNNTINGTGDRVFRFHNQTPYSADITISNNTITSDGDSAGELAKATNALEITFNNNSWNGMTDAQVLVAVPSKIINITAK